MSTYLEHSSESSSQDVTSQDPRAPSQRKPVDYNEYREEVEEENLETNFEDDDEEEGNAWDDRALIAAWDVAVKEYQSFHSIEANKVANKTSKTSAKNETISDIIPTASTEVQEDQEEREEIEEGKLPPPENYYHIPPPPPDPQPQFYPSHPPSMPTDPNISFPGGRPPKPPAMVPPMPGFDDDALTNLMMAWYYSGYYTGLYQGRRGR